MWCEQTLRGKAPIFTESDMSGPLLILYYSLGLVHMLRLLWLFCRFFFFFGLLNSNNTDIRTKRSKYKAFILFLTFGIGKKKLFVWPYCCLTLTKSLKVAPVCYGEIVEQGTALVGELGNKQALLCWVAIPGTMMGAAYGMSDPCFMYATGVEFNSQYCLYMMARSRHLQR